MTGSYSSFKKIPCTSYRTCKSETTQTSHKSKQLKLDIHEDFLPADFEFAGLGTLISYWWAQGLVDSNARQHYFVNPRREVLGGFLKLPWQTKIYLTEYDIKLTATHTA